MRPLPVLLLLLACLPLETALARGAPFVGDSFAEAPCRAPRINLDPSGPFDYLDRRRYGERLKLNESYHFTPNVEYLISGSSSVNVEDDLVFMLWFWPNHHRALNSISRYNLRVSAQGRRLRVPAECWLQRAVNFSPRDANAHMLYAMYLQQTGHLEDARTAYQAAMEIEPRNLELSYNYSLLLIDLGEFESARQRAKGIYAAGYPLPGLRNKLERAGYWREQPTQAPEAGR